MLMTMPCAGVPLMTPRRPVALVRANVAADRIARTAPNRCTHFLPRGLFAHFGQRVRANCLGLLEANGNRRLMRPVKGSSLHGCAALVLDWPARRSWDGYERVGVGWRSKNGAVSAFEMRGAS